MDRVSVDLDSLSPKEKRALLTRLVAQAPDAARIFPLSFAQQRLWFLDQLAPNSPFYNQSLAMRVMLPLDAVVLERALNEIVARHAALRTTFRSVDGEAVQAVAPKLHVTVPVIDLSHLTDAERS